MRGPQRQAYEWLVDLLWWIVISLLEIGVTARLLDRRAVIAGVVIHSSSFLAAGALGVALLLWMQFRPR